MKRHINWAVLFIGIAAYVGYRWYNDHHCWIYGFFLGMALQQAIFHGIRAAKMKGYWR